MGGELPTEHMVSNKEDILWYIEKEGFTKAAFQHKLIAIRKKYRLSKRYVTNAVRDAVKELQHVRHEMLKQDQQRDDAVKAIARMRGVELKPDHVPSQDDLALAILEENVTTKYMRKKRLPKMFEPLEPPTLTARGKTR
jgi:hypothetical protein